MWVGCALLSLAEAFGLVEIVLGDDDRRQENERLRLRAVAEEGDERLYRTTALAAGELLDGGGQAPVADLDQGLRQRVEAKGDDVIDVAGLQCLDRAEDHVVVAGHDD